jgi:hypothetical protein
MKTKIIQLLLIFLSSLFIRSHKQDLYCQILSGRVNSFISANPRFEQPNVFFRNLKKTNEIDRFSYLNLLSDTAPTESAKYTITDECLKQDDSILKQRVTLVTIDVPSLKFQVNWEDPYTSGKIGKLSIKTPIEAVFILKVDAKNNISFTAKFNIESEDCTLGSCCECKYQTGSTNRCDYACKTCNSVDKYRLDEATEFFNSAGKDQVTQALIERFSQARRRLKKFKK